MEDAVAWAGASERRRDHVGARGKNRLNALHTRPEARPRRRHVAALLRAVGIDRIGPDMIELVPDLMKFVPPAKMFDKHVYSPWTGSALHMELCDAGVNTVVITGGETDVCVLASMLGAIDWGFRVILVTDALRSSADETHDAMINIYLNRFGEQVETVTTDTLLEGWPGSARARKAS
jgi:nicotinamidase-related amidase